MDTSTTSVFRERVSSKTETLPEGKEAALNNTTSVEEPFSLQKGKPFVADYFGLGDLWNDAIGGYPREIEEITSYLKSKVQSGEIADTVEAVKELVKKMERTNNLHKESRVSIKIPVLASYVKFLTETRSYGK